MPGSDDQYDQVHTYSQDHAGKSKTTKPAVRELGRDGAPVRLFVGDERDETAVRTPPAGVVYTFINTNGNPRVIDSTGTVASPVDGQAISPSSVTTGQINNETIVTTESELDDALANNKEVIRVSGSISGITSTKTYNVEGGRITAHGSIDTSGPTLVGDGLAGDVAGPLLDLAAGQIEVEGIAVINTNTGGTAIEHSAGSRVEGRSIYLSAGDKGWHASSTAYESILHDARIRNNANTPAGSIGVHFDGPTDCELNGGFVIGYDTAIDGTAASPTFVSDVHTYGVNNMSVGVAISTGKVLDSYIEGTEITDAAVKLQGDNSEVSDSRIQVGQGADGVEVVGNSAQVYEINVTDTYFKAASGSTGNAPVTGTNVTSWNRSTIEGNSFDPGEFSVTGVRTKNSGFSSGTVDLTTAGKQTVTGISHDLGIQPNNYDIDLRFRSSEFDWAAQIVRAENWTVTDFDVVVNVTSTSGTSSASASIIWSIDAGEDH